MCKQRQGPRIRGRRGHPGPWSLSLLTKRIPTNGLLYALIYYYYNNYYYYYYYYYDYDYDYDYYYY